MDEGQEVVQYSIDIVSTHFSDAKRIAKILEDAGYIIKGIDWKATWDEVDYDKGKPPKSWD